MSKLRGYYIRNPKGAYLGTDGPGSQVWLPSWERAIVFPGNAAISICRHAWEDGEATLAMVPVFSSGLTTGR